MRKWLIILIVTIVSLSSCKTMSFNYVRAKYTYNYDLYNEVLVFPKGKWLVNYMESDFQGQDRIKLRENLLEKLKGMAPDSVYYLGNISLKYVLPRFMKFDIATQTLMRLKETENYDYLINTRIKQVKSDFGRVMLKLPISGKKNVSECCIEVYDIKTGNKIYSQTVRASVKVKGEEEQSYDTKIIEPTIAKSSRKLGILALRKSLKKLKKVSVTN